MATALPQQDTALLSALQDGDEAVFVGGGPGLGAGDAAAARAHVPSEAIAEEVVPGRVTDPAWARPLERVGLEDLAFSIVPTSRRRAASRRPAASRSPRRWTPTASRARTAATPASWQTPPSPGPSDG